MDKVKITKMRYLKVLNSIKDDYAIKLFISSGLWVWTLLENIFSTNLELIVLLVISVIVDWISGHISAKKEGLEIVSFGWRQTIVKVIEYTLFLGILVGVANVFGESKPNNWVGTIFSTLKHIDYFGFFYLIITELKSIAENLSGKKGEFTKLLDFVKDKAGLKDLE